MKSSLFDILTVIGLLVLFIIGMALLYSLRKDILSARSKKNHEGKKLESDRDF